MVKGVNSRGSEPENPPKNTLSKGSLENLKPLELPEDAVINSDKVLFLPTYFKWDWM
jgi:hypothetical protein